MEDLAESGTSYRSETDGLEVKQKLRKDGSTGRRQLIPFLILVFLVLVILAYYLGTTKSLMLHGNLVNLQARTIMQYFNDKREVNHKFTWKTKVLPTVTSKHDSKQGSRTRSMMRRKFTQNVTQNNGKDAESSETLRSKSFNNKAGISFLKDQKAKPEKKELSKKAESTPLKAPSSQSKPKYNDAIGSKTGNSKPQSTYPSNLAEPNSRAKAVKNKDKNSISIQPRVAMQGTTSQGVRSFDYEKWHTKRTTEICGTGWQERYKKLHTEILSKRREEKYLVYLCPGTRQGCCGYGNRLRAVASLFYLAVLTDRAFLIDWRAPEPIENHLSPRNIQWNYSAPIDICTGLPIRKHYWGTTKTDVREAEGWIIQDSKHFKSWLIGTDLKSYFDWPVEEITTIWYFAEGGLTLNPFLMQRAKELGLQPLLSNKPSYTRIGCAFDFLFSRSEALENKLTQVKKNLQFDKGPVIGIHVRTGDDQFDFYASDNDRTWNLKNVSRLLKFFDCAQEVEKKVFGNDTKERSKVRWFVSTDHIRVRNFSRKRFPQKVITSNLTIQHLDILFNTTVLNFTAQCNYTDASNTTMVCYNVEMFNVTEYCANRTNGSVEAENNGTMNGTGPFTDGITAMLIDHFMLVESDFLILCDSSFGSTAVGLSMRDTDSYTFGDQGCIDLLSAQTRTKLRFFGR